MFHDNVAYLSGGYMLTSMLGFLLSALYVFPRSQVWGFTFSLFFVLMFVASMVSMTYGPDASLEHIAKKRK